MDYVIEEWAHKRIPSTHITKFCETCHMIHPKPRFMANEKYEHWSLVTFVTFGHVCFVFNWFIIIKLYVYALLNPILCALYRFKGINLTTAGKKMAAKR